MFAQLPPHPAVSEVVAPVPRLKIASPFAGSHRDATHGSTVVAAGSDCSVSNSSGSTLVER